MDHHYFSIQSRRFNDWPSAAWPSEEAGIPGVPPSWEPRIFEFDWQSAHDQSQFLTFQQRKVTRDETYRQLLFAEELLEAVEVVSRGELLKGFAALAMAEEGAQDRLERRWGILHWHGKRLNLAEETFIGLCESAAVGLQSRPGQAAEVGA